MDFKKKVFIYLGVCSVLLLFVLGLRFAETKYNESTIASNQQVQQEYNINVEAGEKLVPCALGGHDIYKPNKSLVVCGTALTPEIIDYLNNLE